MPQVISIRLSDADRDTLLAQAKERHEGLSTLVRGLAEREAHALRTASVRAQTEAFMERALGDPKLLDEVDSLGTPQTEPPDREAWWPAR